MFAQGSSASLDVWEGQVTIVIEVCQCCSLEEEGYVKTFPFGIQIESVYQFRIVAASDSYFIFRIDDTVAVLVFVFDITRLCFAELRLRPVIGS